ncbi:MAG: signal recognition particle protein [Candidatus Obscuribacterales bacterium]|nr:signal recognition particle protein [Candidatus Obscuribacterales bacterium]
MFDTLTDRLHSTFRNLTGDGKLTAENIEEAIGDVRKSLLEADVSLKVVKIFISRVRQKALGKEVLESVTPAQQFVKIVHDELVTILGVENSPLETNGDPAVIMLLGLQGSGKTTACGKLAYKLREEGMKPLMVACDVQRPAAIAQLQTLGKQIDIPVFSVEGQADVQEIAEAAIAHAKKEGLHPVILDTAGRLQVDTPLMAELMILDRAFEPVEKLLVVDSMTGQEAVNVADTFNTQLTVTGLILSKVDGDARGGAALSVREIVGKPIKFISTGEKLDNLETFYPDRMAGRILDMGDILSLVEKAQQNIDEKEAERVAMDMLKGDFTLEMFVEMQKMMKKMGSIGDIMKMMGVGGMFGLSTQQQKAVAEHGEQMMSLYETAINSMTKAERKNPEMIDFNRRRRIARGSGLKDAQIGQMLNEFQQMKSMMAYMKPLMGGGGGGLPGLPGLGLPGMPGVGSGGRGMPGAAPGRLPFATPTAARPSGANPSGFGRGRRLRKKKRKP